MNRVLMHFSAIEKGLEDLPEQKSIDALNREFIKHLTRDYQKLLAYIVTFAPNHQDAEDLMQETIIQIWSKFDEFESDRNFYRWGVGFARNVIRQYHRDRKPDHLTLDSGLLSQLSTSRLAVEEVLEIRRDAMQRCIASLPDSQWQLFKSCYIGHKSIPLAAKTLGKTVTALNNKLHRIRMKLTDCIDRRLRQLNRAEGGSDDLI